MKKGLVVRPEIKDFMENLNELPKTDISILKRNAGFTIGQSRGATGIFFRILPPKVGSRFEEIYFLVATLYGLNDGNISGNFGETMREVKKATGSANLDRRMAILLESEFGLIENFKIGGGEMGYRLRQNIKLAKSKEVGVNWEELLSDLCWWNDPEKRVQKRWARAYYGQESKS